MPMVTESADDAEGATGRDYGCCPIVSQVSRQPLAQLWLSLTNEAWNGAGAGMEAGLHHWVSSSNSLPSIVRVSPCFAALVSSKAGGVLKPVAAT